MLILAGTSDLIQVVTSAVSDIEVHTSWVDNNAGAITPGRTNTPSIVTATTTTVVGSPAASTQRNVKHINIANNHASASCTVSVTHTDGTTVILLMNMVLLPGENMMFNAEGRWAHRDWNGAEYPPAGLGAYSGFPVPFMKSGTASDVAGCWYSTSKDAGFPGAWVPGTPGVNGRATDGSSSTDNGCIPIKNPSIGANYLTELQMASSVPHSHLFYDVLWVNSGLVVTTTGAQAIVTPTLPARDINGATLGEGCMIGLLVTTVLANAAANAAITVSYVNHDGTGGTRTATLSALTGSQLPQTAVVGTIIWFNLQAGDKGVKSISSISLGTTLVSGAISLFIARDIATIGTTLANTTGQKVIGMPGIRLYNNSCVLHCIMCSATTATFHSGELTIMEK